MAKKRRTASDKLNTLLFGKDLRVTEGELAKKLFNGKSRISDIIIKDVRASGVELPIIIAGYRQKGRVKRVENITFKNLSIKYADIPETVDRRMFIPEYAREYPECWRFRNLPAYALWIRHAENVHIENFNCIHPKKTWKKAIIKEDVI